MVWYYCILPDHYSLHLLNMWMLSLDPRVVLACMILLVWLREFRTHANTSADGYCRCAESSYHPHASCTRTQHAASMMACRACKHSFNILLLLHIHLPVFNSMNSWNAFLVGVRLRFSLMHANWLGFRDVTQTSVQTKADFQTLLFNCGARIGHFCAPSESPQWEKRIWKHPCHWSK